MKKVKYLPNYITISRIFCSVVLLYTIPFSLLFYIVYSICGFSDVLDGYLARKTNTASAFGAKLDSIADFIFIAVSLYIFIFLFSWPLWAQCWVCLIVVVRVFSLIIGFIKYHTFAALHTYANKATGLFLFLFPFLYSLIGLYSTTILLCCLATISGIEELVINLTSKTLLRDARTIFKK